jgi:protein-S-isoprenylcysteine O-methyltransferase Ste14
MQYVYTGVIVLWLGFELAYGIRFAGRGNLWQDRLSGPALVGGIVLAMWLGARAASAVPQAAITVARPELFALGIAVALFGIGLRFYAIRVLGRFFTLRVATRSDQMLIEDGPYRLVRHPSYTGALLTVFGLLLCSANWLTLLCFLIALPGIAYRISVEERALEGALGDQYRDYMRRTKRLIPRVL